MRAHVLSIGSELILGHLTDTNATFLAQQMVALGIELLHVTQVGDDLPRLVGTLRHAAAGADLIVCTGGVGPTDDDLTREAIAALVEDTPTVDPALLDGIRAFFVARGLTMPEQNAKQAWIIPAAEPLPNPVGTAPGWFVRHDGTIVVAMPGVPREMFRMWQEQAVPRLLPFLPERAVRSITIKTLGIGESAAAQLLDDLIKREDPVVATYAKDDGVQVRVTAVAPTPSEALARLNPAAAEVRRRLAAHIYGEDDVSLPAALAALLRRHDADLGVLEIGSGGRFGGLLLGDPAAAPVVRGLLVADPSDTPPADRALHAREHFASTLGLALIVEVAPIGNDVYEGTATVALSGPTPTEEPTKLRGGFADVQRRAALHAADVLRRHLTTSA